MINLIFYLVIGFGSTTVVLLAIPYFLKLIRFIFRKTRYSAMGGSSKIRLVRQLDDAIYQLSKSKVGAIITIVNKRQLDGYRTDGVKLNADISAQLIVSIFNKTSPLHDGAIIIDNNKIVYAGTYFKITNKSLNNNYGARHRAAIGISEQTDALTIVVSEETGAVTFVKNATIIKIKKTDFQEKITAFIS